MLRIMGLVMLVPLGFLVGQYLAKNYKNRLFELTACEQMLAKIMMYIDMQNMPTGEMISRLASSESLARLRFLTLCRDRLGTSRDFPAAWRESLEQSRPSMALKEQDMAIVLRLREVLGSMDAAGIKGAVSLMKAEIAHNIVDADEQSRVKGALFTKLGVLVGILAAILLI